MMISCQTGREKPVCVAFRRKSWNSSGKRVHRGLYQTKNGLLVNADVNGAANILKKK
ncbi:hypothetical protein [Okeania sp. SIO3B5]|uniref:hypothetical protein n=1 Tax=Okeania sp. SIO3B5 TaxID=2607811 RepID=UPI0025FECB77|nr:hypothetical protein [Okeania sp. SIO3B5]